MKKLILTILLLSTSAALTAIMFLGCTDKEAAVEKGETEMEKRKDMTLVGVEYINQNGMVNGADLYMHIEKDRIVSARYFSWEGDDGDYISVEDVPIEQEQWEAIEGAVMTIVPLTEEIQNNEPGFLEKLFMKAMPQPTDGPNYSGFFLIWQSEDGEKERVRYYIPSDRRFSTVVSLMEETVNPVGREIIYYDAPVLTGIYFGQGDSWSGKKDNYSYQLTLKNSAGQEKEEDADMEWRFNAYYSEDGERKSLNTYATKETWLSARVKCEELKLDSFPETTSREKTFATLYYSDGKQITVKPDKKTIKELQTYFESLVSDIKEK